jgi:hypothetical protein
MEQKINFREPNIHQIISIDQYNKLITIDDFHMTLENPFMAMVLNWVEKNLII